ncbi:MAG TPA: sodium:solute symporter [Phycisphaerales bacterium]|nr:sodium:solute symporter [Phycisphaerales bacterium]
MALTLAAFGTADWLVLGAYFALLIATGVWLARLPKGDQDYFLAGRRMPAWAVSVSVLATSLSAATFIGAPQQAYEGNLTYLSATIGTLLAAIIVAGVFLPAFYRHGVTTVYGLLEKRFGPGAKLAGSWTFVVGRVFASGARVYIAAHALSFIVFGDLRTEHLLIAIAALTFAGILYTIAGGIETVIWTDVVQTVVFLGAVLGVIVHLGAEAGAPPAEAVASLAEAGKFKVLDFSLDPARPYTLWTALVGITLLNTAALGADQDLAQRLLTCRSAMRAAWSVISSQLLGLGVVCLFMTIGLLLWLRNAHDTATPQGGEKAFLAYMTGALPTGLAGVVMAGLFAAGLGSIDSALNAMSSAFVSDCYRPARPGRSERHYLRVARAGVAVSGVLLGGFACVCVFWQRGAGQTLLDFALQVMVFAYAGLVAVFLCALLTRRGTTASAIGALAAGFAITVALEPAIWERATGLDTIAFPWRMTVASTVAFMIAAAPRGRASSRA